MKIGLQAPSLLRDFTQYVSESKPVKVVAVALVALATLGALFYYYRSTSPKALEKPPEATPPPQQISEAEKIAKSKLSVWKSLADRINVKVTLPSDVKDVESQFTAWAEANKAELATLDTFSLRDYVGPTLPAQLRHLTGLTKLMINNATLAELPDWWSNFPHLNTLQIMNCSNLRTLPASLTKCLSLTHLTCMRCALEKLPEAIGNLVNLETLNVGANALENLPESFGKLTNLKSLSLFRNKLQALPQNLDRFWNLHTFCVYLNPLQLSPALFTHMSGLRLIEMSTSQGVEGMKPLVGLTITIKDK